jgi:hypothetical protein
MRVEEQGDGDPDSSMPTAAPVNRAVTPSASQNASSAQMYR